jgi:hypothetical protein
MILADASASTATVWIAGLLAASGGIGSLVSIISLFTTRRELELVKGELGNQMTALGTRLGKLEEDFKGLHADIRQMERRLTDASEQRAVDTHERVNQVLEAVAELRGRFNESRTHDHR